MSNEGMKMTDKKDRPAFWISGNGSVHVNPKYALDHPKVKAALAAVARLRAIATQP